MSLIDGKPIVTAATTDDGAGLIDCPVWSGAGVAEWYPPQTAAPFRSEVSPQSWNINPSVQKLGAQSIFLTCYFY